MANCCCRPLERSPTLRCRISFSMGTAHTTASIFCFCHPWALPARCASFLQPEAAQKPVGSGALSRWPIASALPFSSWWVSNYQRTRCGRSCWFSPPMMHFIRMILPPTLRPITRAHLSSENRDRPIFSVLKVRQVLLKPWRSTNTAWRSGPR